MLEKHSDHVPENSTCKMAGEHAEERLFYQTETEM